MANSSQLAKKPPERGQTVIGNAPVGPRSFDPGAWGQIALKTKMESSELHPNFSKVRKELTSKHGYQVTESGLLEGRISATQGVQEDFIRPSIDLKNHKSGQVKKWVVSIPLVEEMASRPNFPKFIGNLGTTKEVFALVVDYQNWFNSQRYRRKRQNRDNRDRPSQSEKKSKCPGLSWVCED